MVPLPGAKAMVYHVAIDGNEGAEKCTEQRVQCSITIESAIAPRSFSRLVMSATKLLGPHT